MPNLDDIKTIPAFCKRYSDITNEQQLRWAIWKRDVNGLSEAGAVFKRGGRWYVLAPKYLDWILSGDK
jgi:hypothetical protein